MWASIFNAGLGLWLMCSPSVLGYTGLARPHDWVVGPIVTSLAVCACWEVTRSLRWVNAVIGVWLVLAPWILGYGQMTPIVNSSVVGVVLTGLSLIRGRIQNRFAGGWVSLFKNADDMNY